MSEYKKPKIGQKLFFPKYGILTVKARGTFKRGSEDEIGITANSEYSIMEDSNGNIITNAYKPAWFYDDFLTKDNFELATKLNNKIKPLSSRKPPKSMDKLIENIQHFEKRNNVSAIVVVYSDGSNEVKEFWDSENLASFKDMKSLHEFLENATYKMSENGRMISPSKLICSLCRQEEPCNPENATLPCVFIQEREKFITEENE